MGDAIAKEFDFKTIFKQFLPSGSFTAPVIYGNGHINDTFFSVIKNTDGTKVKLILQRINSNIFKDIPSLMANIFGVTEHLKKSIALHGGDVLRETLTIIPTNNGELFFDDNDGGFWRIYLFIDNSTTYQSISSPKDFFCCGKSFGHFQSLMSTYPAKKLCEPIKDFHNTPKRFSDFLQAMDGDICCRKKFIEKEIDFAISHQSLSGEVSDLLLCGKLPLRVIHNDTKLNNILFDKKNNDALCVIDLDTVMPGAVAYDFGDSIRFGASTGAEDENDLRKITLSLPLFEQFTKGYLASAANFLTSSEISSLAIGAKVMTFECGIRFLTDYLNGDQYFKISHPNHNLERCRTQFKLLTDMEEKYDNMQNIVNNIYADIESKNFFQSTENAR